MICWKCDVCEKIGESATSQMHVTVMPEGWRQRHGRAPLPDNSKDFYDIQVHVCSPACARQYDWLEAEKVGGAWQHPTVTTLTGEFVALRPLKVSPK